MILFHDDFAKGEEPMTGNKWLGFGDWPEPDFGSNMCAGLSVEYVFVDTDIELNVVHNWNMMMVSDR